MQVGDVLRITACQEILSQRVCNIFFYSVALWTGNATLQDILNEFKTDVVDKVTPLQSGALEWVNLRLDNVSNDLDFQEMAISAFGGKSAATPASSFVASSWRLIVGTKLTRAGYKRFAGVTPSQIVNNDYQPNDAPAVGNLETALQAELHDGTFPGTDFRITPVVVGRNTDGSYDLNRVNPIDSCGMMTYVTSQNSRKPGRGQ